MVYAPGKKFYIYFKMAYYYKEHGKKRSSCIKEICSKCGFKNSVFPIP